MSKLCPSPSALIPFTFPPFVHSTDYLDFLDCINPFKLIEICCGDVKKTGFAGEGIFGKLAFCSISMAGPKDSIGEIAAALFQTGPSYTTDASQTRNMNESSIRESRVILKQGIYVCHTLLISN